MDLQDLKVELRSTVSSSSFQMRVSDLASDYKMMNGIHVPFKKFNCSSLAEFIKRECTDIFKFDDSIADFILHPIIPENLKNMNDLIMKQNTHKNKCNRNKRTSVALKRYSQNNPVPNTKKKSCSNYTQKQVHSKPNNVYPKRKQSAVNPTIVSDEFINTSSSSSQDEALPYISTNHVVCPENCMKITEIIETPQLLKKNSYHEVYVAQVTDPSHFWFHIYSLDCGLALEALMAQMNLYYNKHSYSCIMPESFLKVGQYCAVPYLDVFHRAMIVEEPKNKTVKVNFVDYGTIESISVNNVKFLLREYSKLPIQAFRGRLAHVIPVSQRWNHASINCFLNAVMEKRVYAKIVNIDEKNKVYSVDLVDTSAETVDVHVFEILKNEGFATIDKSIALVHKCLEPSFDMLEMGGKYMLYEEDALNPFVKKNSKKSETYYLDSSLNHSSDCENSNVGINSFEKNISSNMDNLMSKLSITATTPPENKVQNLNLESKKSNLIVSPMAVITNIPMSEDSNVNNHKYDKNVVTITLAEVAVIGNKNVEIWKFRDSVMEKPCILIEQIAYTLVYNDREGFIEDIYKDDKYEKLIIYNQFQNITKNLLMFGASGLSVGESIETELITTVENYKFNLLFLSFDHLINILLRFNSRIVLKTRIYVPDTVKLIKKLQTVKN